MVKFKNRVFQGIWGEISGIHKWKGGRPSLIKRLE